MISSSDLFGVILNKNVTELNKGYHFDCYASVYLIKSLMFTKLVYDLNTIVSNDKSPTKMIEKYFFKRLKSKL